MLFLGSIDEASLNYMRPHFNATTTSHSQKELLVLATAHGVH